MYRPFYRGKAKTSRKDWSRTFGCLVWLRLQVTNSLTGVERYKSDTVCIELDRSNNEPQGGAVMTDNEQLKREFTEFYKLYRTDGQVLFTG